MMSTRLFWVVFSLITCVALFFRVYQLETVPPSPYWEEVALGYDAYSILHTGKDHHGTPFPLVAFESYGDWKPSLYFYAIIPFIKVVGLSVVAVRLPAALSGVLIVVGVGMLAKLLATKDQNPRKTQLIAMAITAISPWAIQFSRGGWEVNLATALTLWGVVLFLLALKRPRKTLILVLSSVTLLSLAAYTYHATRVIAPLIGISLAGLWFVQQGRQRLHLLVVGGLLAIGLLAPLLLASRSTQTTQRFAETSIFSDISIIEESNARKAIAGNSWWSALVYHRYVLFGREMLSHALSHFSLEFLVISGDANPRHSTQEVGLIYHIELVFLIVGAIYLVKNGRRDHVLLVAWVASTLLPVSMTQATPHALRILPMLPVIMLVITVGVERLLNWLPHMMKPMLLILYIGEGILFWRVYTTVYVKRYAQEWQYGYQGMVAAINKTQQELQLPVYITREYGRPAMYYFFYTTVDPNRVQAADSTAKQDQGEFLEFERIRFVNSVSEVTESRALVASSPSQKDTLEKILTQNNPNAGTQLIETVSDPTGKPVWVVYTITSTSHE